MEKSRGVSGKSDLTKKDDNMLASLKNTVDQLTQDKKDLELTLSELWVMLERATESNKTLQATCDELVSAQESHEAEKLSLEKYYEEKLKSLRSEHETDVTEILESSNFHVQKLIRENEEVIRDMLRGCEGLFAQLKREFNEEVRTDVALKTSSGLNLMGQFRGLETEIKVVVVAGIVVISVAACWAGWSFISWVWPRLLAFAEGLSGNSGTVLLLSKLLIFLNSGPFQKFTESWEQGKTLGECLMAFTNTDFLTCAMKMAPELFAQLKNSQGRQAALM